MSESESPLIRLQKVIADSGITSRRKAEELIVQGLVKVNRKIVRELGTKVDPSIDVVEVNGEILNPQFIEKIYLVLNKPRAVMCTVSDPEGRETVLDYCKGIKMRLFPVGRLDYLSEGLIIITNDGDIAHEIMHPRHEVIKTYEVKVFGKVTEIVLKKMRQGVMSKGELLKPLSVKIVGELPKKTWIEVQLKEGKNREIRRLCEELGVTVDKLRRVAIGGLTISGIAPGNFDIYTRKKLLQLVRSEYAPAKGIKIKNKKHGKSEVLAADDPAFIKYRKKHYQMTIRRTKENEADKEQKEAKLKTRN
ncbi:MAG: rRNA pseudouridine synthase [Bacteriovoracaceae bacterium]|nr:rRNA pseudouridine synthase [Bacteriovoracaceae bacterium]